MAGDEEQPDEHSSLLRKPHGLLTAVRQQDNDANSVVSSHVSKEERVLGETAVGERLPYNDYTTIDWLHDLVQ